MAKRETPDVLNEILNFGAEARERKKPSDKPKAKRDPEGVRVNVYLNEPLLNRAKVYAARRHWNTSLLIREALEEYLAKYDTV